MKIIDNKINSLLKHKMTWKLKKNQVFNKYIQMNKIDKQKCLLFLHPNPSKQKKISKLKIQKTKIFLIIS